MSPVSSSFLTKPRLQHLMLTAEIGQIHPRFAVGKIQNATRTEKQDRQNQSVTTNPADFTIGGQRASCQAKKCQMALGASPTPSQKAERRLGTGAGEHVPIRAVQEMSLDIRILDIVGGGMSIIRFSSPKGSETFPVFFWLKINPRCSGRREELAGDWKLLCPPANSNQTRAPSLFLNRRKDDASIFACLCGSTATGWRETVVCPWFFSDPFHPRRPGHHPRSEQAQRLRQHLCYFCRSTATGRRERLVYSMVLICTEIAA